MIVLLFLFSFFFIEKNYASSNSTLDFSSIEKQLQKQSKRLKTHNGKKEEVNKQDNDVFWFYKENSLFRYKILGENDGQRPPTQSDPILLNGKFAPSTYNPQDYPAFNPIIVLDEDLTLGERERIKKSFILIKIVLHTDQFKKMIKEHQKIFEIKEYLEPVYKYSSVKRNPLVPLKNIMDIYHYLMNNFLAVYILKLPGDAISSRTIADATTGNPKKSIKKKHSYIGGVMRIYNDGKALNYFTHNLPMILFHEMIHVAGYPHIHHFDELEHLLNVKNSPYDISYQLGKIFETIYGELNFPTIKSNCYSGNKNIWNEC